MSFTDDFGNVSFKKLPWSCIAHFLLEFLSLTDNHNADNKNVLRLEDCWPAKKLMVQSVTTQVGMCVAGLRSDGN